MRLLKRIAVSNGDQNRKDTATATIAERDRDIIAGWNKDLENELWQKIIERIEKQGFSGIGKNSATQ
ncbi:hypothetical protein ACFLXQ_03955 [Chloroflexota bacterium]